jgi:hypothetical protein
MENKNSTGENQTGDVFSVPRTHKLTLHNQAQGETY